MRASWSRFDNATGETWPSGRREHDHDRDGPAGLLPAAPGSFIEIVSADSAGPSIVAAAGAHVLPPHEDGWKLVGLEPA
jgi:hypothetical protein